MEENQRFYKVNNVDELTAIKSEWLNSLISPQDGMWESFRNNGIYWGIEYKGKLIGYASIGEGNRLLQFYISPTYSSKGETIFKNFIENLKISSGMVGTNNPIYLSLALNFVEKLDVDTYLFRDHYNVQIGEKDGILNECQKEDLEKIVDFYHFSMGAPKEWLTGYINGLIERRELFSLDHDDKVIGTSEVRKSKTEPKYADIGMVVSPEFRRKGYGTYLLNQAKTIALDWGKIPICSCEKGNIGSVKSIHNCGFVNKYQLLAITFKQKSEN